VQDALKPVADFGVPVTAAIAPVPRRRNRREPDSATSAWPLLPPPGVPRSGRKHAVQDAGENKNVPFPAQALFFQPRPRPENDPRPRGRPPLYDWNASGPTSLFLLHATCMQGQSSQLKLFHMGSWSDAAVSGLQWWLGWLAICATALGMLAAIGTLLIRQESSRRQSAKELERTTRLVATESSLQEAETRLRAANDRVAALETVTKPRRLTPNQIIDLSAQLRHLAPQSYDLLWYPDDQESLRIAEDIFAATQAAGWTFDYSKEFLAFTIVLGVVIEYAPSQAAKLSPVAAVLTRALEAQGLRAEHKPSVEERFPDKLRIKVGKKP
jgi:hypothetical protein